MTTLLIHRVLHFRYLIALIGIGLQATSGCTKFVQIDPPQTQVEAELVFSTAGSAVSAINGLYSRMTQANLTICSGAMTLYPGLSADECYHTVSSPDNDRFLSNSLVPDNGTGNYSRLWRSAYQTLYNANAILEGLEESTGITDSIRQQLSGEALVVRSLCYFYLVNLYGAVPFTTSTNYTLNQSLTRTDPSAVYAGMIADLIQAKSLLKNTYPSVGRARPNRATATALLARVYLYTGNWAKAEAEATEVIGNGMYSLAPVLSTVFAQSSPETIWQLAKDNGNTGEGATFVPASATVRPGYAITNTLLTAFETVDKRKAAWLGKNTVTGVDFFYPAKYKVRATTPITEYYVVFRLAEQYLIRSEARAMLNNFSGSRVDLEMSRNRAGLTPITATTQVALLAALEKERQLELCLEWGHRWLDIKRWAKADIVFGPLKAPNWQTTDGLYPIPLREIQTNLALTQNPGY